MIHFYIVDPIWTKCGKMWRMRWRLRYSSSKTKRERWSLWNRCNCQKVNPFSFSYYDISMILWCFTVKLIKQNQISINCRLKFSLINIICSVVHRYKTNQVINVKLKLTKNHLGTFKFNLCPLNETFHLETEQCFNQYPLKLVNQYNYDFPVPNLKTEFDITVRIPNITCKQCVFRWTYKAENNFGRCYENQNPTIQCGLQETIRNCADIAIESDENS